MSNTKDKNYINMSEDKYETLSHEELFECYTEIVNILGDYVMKMNTIDVKRNKIINILRKRSGEELEQQNNSASDNDSEP